LYQPDYERWRGFLLEHARRIGHPAPEGFAAGGWRLRAGGRGMDHARASIDKQVCLVEDRTFTYRLTRPYSDDLLEFLRPFGNVKVSNDDGVILQAEIVQGKAQSLFARIKATRPRSMLRVTFAKTCNLRLSSQRFEKQLKRFQSCVLCGSCSSMCGPRAISVNGRYTVDAHKCVGCMACVCGSCIGIESFTRKGTAQKWSVCSGSV